MGGSPRKPDKPRPSYEDGRLRDSSIEKDLMEPITGHTLATLIAKAAKADREDSR